MLSQIYITRRVMATAYVIAILYTLNHFFITLPIL